jgi:hypothetical protein
MQTLKFSKPFSSLFQVKTLNMLASRVSTWANLVTKSNSFARCFLPVLLFLKLARFRQIQKYKNTKIENEVTFGGF